MTGDRELTDMTQNTFKEIATAISIMDSSSHAEDMMIEVAEKQGYFPDADSKDGWDDFIKGTLIATKVMHLIGCLRVADLKHTIGASTDRSFEMECRAYLDANLPLTRDMLRTCEVYGINASSFITDEVKKEYMSKKDKDLNSILRGLADMLCDEENRDEVLARILSDDEDESETEDEVSTDANGDEYRIQE